MAPAVAPDLPLAPPAPELFAPPLECAELSELPFALADAFAFAEPPALAEALALLFECDEVSDVAPDFALASLLLPALLEELDELVDLPPPAVASELFAEPAAF